MRRKFAIATTIGWALIGLAPCIGQDRAEDAYMRIFSSIQQADQRAARQEPESARTNYVPVLEALQSFQHTYPTWNPEVVAYRMRYLQRRMAADAGAGARHEGTQVAGPSESAGGSSPEARATALLGARVSELEQERELLNAKLKEALAARPASVDPAELSRALGQLRAQEKENDLLRAQLAKEKGPSAALALAKELETLRGTLQSTEAALTAEKTRADDLKGRNEELRRRVAALERDARRVNEGRDRTRVLALAPVPVAPVGSPPPGPVLPTEEAISQAQGLLDGRDAAGAGRVLEAVPVGARTNAAYGSLWGQVLIAQGRGTEAVRALGQFAQEHPQNAEIHQWLGWALLDENLAPAAEDVLRRAVALDAKCGGAHLALAELYSRQRPPDVALARWHYQRAVECGALRDASLETKLQLAEATQPSTPNPARTKEPGRR